MYPLYFLLLHCVSGVLLKVFDEFSLVVEVLSVSADLFSAFDDSPTLESLKFGAFDGFPLRIGVNLHESGVFSRVLGISGLLGSGLDREIFSKGTDFVGSVLGSFDFSFSFTEF